MEAKNISLEELEAITELIKGTKTEELTALVKEIQKAERIFIGGAGRSLLAMKAFAMRLMQIDLETHLTGEVCTPAVKAGDLLIVASGKGRTGVTLELVKKAKSHGARTAVITQHPEAPIPQQCDCVVGIPLTPEVKPADSVEAEFTKTQMPGNIPEAGIMILTDGIIAKLMEEAGQDGAVIDDRHANLE